MRARILGAALLVTLAARLAAAAPDAEAEWAKGTNLRREGRFREAIVVLEALVAGAPDDRFADDALIEIATIYDEDLVDPVAALAAYERLIAAHPESRHAARARVRAEALRARLGPDNRGAAAAAQWVRILGGFAGRPRAETVALIERFLTEHPDAVDAAHAAYLLGTILVDEGRPGDALSRFREVAERWPESEWWSRARRAEGDVLLARGDYAGAERAYRSLGERGDPVLERAADELLAKVRRERWRGRGLIAAWLALVLFVVGMIVACRRAAGSWRETGRALVKPPIEALFFIPVAALFALAATTEHWGIKNAVALISIGAVVIVWLSGATLEAARRRGRLSLLRILAHAAGTALAVASLVYIAIMREHLLDMLIETVRFGPEGH